LFVDFSNAFNTIPHTLLFQKLRKKGCLAEEEIQYLEALYSRYRIRVGNKFIEYNKGVAQGSILSPSLFNIFIEDLVDEISATLMIQIEDILLYADDILVLCNTVDQLYRCITVIENWAKRNGMKLNKQKSGIVPFASRRAHDIPYMENRLINGERKWTPTRKAVNEVPIVECYKYLGTYLNPKLTMEHQIQFIKRKFGWIYTKLYPYLAVASADGRRDLWWTMIVPLFNATMMLRFEEEARHQAQVIFRLWIHTFKKFMMIPKTTYTYLVERMIGIDFEFLVRVRFTNACNKWEQRKKGGEMGFFKLWSVNPLKGISNDWCSILKLQCRLCPQCGKKQNAQLMSSKHMEEVHKVKVIPCEEIWEAIEGFYNWEKEKCEKKNDITAHLDRKVFQKKWGKTLKEIREDMEGKYKGFWARESN
jgi:hypothetical protein